MRVTVGSTPRKVSAEAVLAAIAVCALGFRVQLPFYLPWNAVIASLLLPFTLPHLWRYRGALLISIVAVAAGAAGIALTEARVDATSTPILVSNVSRAVGLGLILAAALWARSTIGIAPVTLAYGLGQLVTVGLTGINSINAWKFSFEFPVVLIVLSLAALSKSRLVQGAACVLLSAVSVAFDSRSSAGFLLVAVALMLSQRTDSAPGGKVRRLKRWLVTFRIAAIGVAAYLLLQAALLEGFLGEQVQERTEIQVATGGSALLGGRPEVGASYALIRAQPGGYGAGAVPSPSEILTGKEGMKALGYDPNNGYVENYMFGSAFEVHSVLGDAWIHFGLLGVVLVVAIAVALVRGLSHNLALGTTSAVAIYLAARGLWDVGFSPSYSAFATIAFALAVVAIPRAAQPASSRSALSH